MSDHLRRVPVAAKVNSFKREVGCNKCFMAWREPQDGAVISNASENVACAARPSLLTDPLNQSFFSQGQNGINI